MEGRDAVAKALIEGRRVNCSWTCPRNNNGSPNSLDGSEMGFTSLAHLIDIDWLLEAFARTRKDGAVVDGQNGEDYAVHLKSTFSAVD